MPQQHAGCKPQICGKAAQLLPRKTRHQADGTRTQRNKRVDGVARQHTADDIGHCTHRKACAGAEHHRRQQYRQTAQIEPDEAGGDAEHTAEHDAHGYQQSQHGQGTHRSFFVVHRSCPP